MGCRRIQRVCQIVPLQTLEHFLKATLQKWYFCRIALGMLAFGASLGSIQTSALSAPKPFDLALDVCQVNLQKKAWEIVVLAVFDDKDLHWRIWRIWRIFPWIWGSIGRVLGMSNCVCESIANRNLKHAMSADTCWSVCKPSQSAERHSDAFYSLQLWAFIFVEF